VLKYMVDIDHTICDTPRINNAWDYTKSTPIQSRIQIINSLFEEGHEIHYWTARGSGSGLDWTDLTVKQLSDWGCKYTTVSLKKPSYDVWIDDKAINDKAFFND